MSKKEQRGKILQDIMYTGNHQKRVYAYENYYGHEHWTQEKIVH